MKILIHSNSPTTLTGYGVQTALLARQLRDAGHDVAVSCTYGQQATGRTWEGIQLFPSGYDAQGNDIVHNHALRWFDGDPLGGWVIILTDLWVMKNPLLADFNVIGWCPVDHFPVPPAVIEFFASTEAVPLAMSEFGKNLMMDAGLDVSYAPLAIDPITYQPTDTIEVAGTMMTGREMLGVPEDAFLVGMTAMNKDPLDRKGFNEAFRAFGAFQHDHPEAVLYVHSDPKGMGTGLDLRELAVHSAIAPHALKFPAAYDLQLSSYSPQMMAAAYTAFDVLLAPSRGEGFCVPLIEAQACGTPVIVSDFSAQPELVGAGWKVTGQPLWDHSQRASYFAASIPSVFNALNTAYDADRESMAPAAIAFAGDYYTDRVFAEHWVPFLHTLEPAEPLELDREPLGDVAVIIPAMARPDNVQPLVDSLGDTATAYFICDEDDAAEVDAVLDTPGARLILSNRGHTFAAKANAAYEATDEPWLFLCGDDVRFTPDWLDAPAKLAARFDVIGTNDAADGNGNPTVQSGQHADHMLVRRAYVDRYGASLDGPGSVCHEGYNHFYVDKELVELAKARNAFSPCLDSIVEHLHPQLGKGRPDLVYQNIRSEKSQADEALYRDRLPLIQMQRRGRGK